MDNELLPLALTGYLVSLLFLYLIIKGAVENGTYSLNKQVRIQNALLKAQMKKSGISIEEIKTIIDVDKKVKSR